VTDNGPCFKSKRFAAFVDRHPELIHIRTRRKSPGQNGVRERAFGSLKYEHLYRHEIDDGHDLGLYADAYRDLFNTIRPHQSLAGRRPIEAHRAPSQTDPTLNLNEPETLPFS
jgi:transposase InsO family protein